MSIIFVVNKNSLNSEHLGIMSLSSILKISGHNVDVVDAEYKKVKYKLKYINNPPILAYSINYFSSSHYLDLNRRIKKEFKVLSVFGGPQPTYCPEMIEEEGVDGICIGEGDYALLELVNNLTEGKPITNISNWWIKQDGQVFRNPPRPLIEDLDSLPFADRTILKNSHAISIVTSRGCLYRCSFCTERRRFRRRSVDSVIAELKEAKAKTRARFVYFYDSTFNVSPTWLREFSDKYRRQVGLPFYCRVRANLVTPEVGRYLKQAGCFSAGMGVETANDYLRNEVLKKSTTKEQIVSAAAIIKRHKIRLITTNMIGLPFGSLDDDLETLKFNIRIKPDYAKASMVSIFKNTDLYYLLVNNTRSNKIIDFPHKGKYWCLQLDLYDSISEIYKIKNLSTLFSLVTKFPFLFPFVSFLIRLRLSKIYKLLCLLYGENYRQYVIAAAGKFGGLRFFTNLKEVDIL